MKKILNLIRIVAILLIIAACSKQPVIDDSVMLDGNKVNDPSITNPAGYLISYKITNPTDKEKETPVVIVVHGYSATTYEWDEFRKWADSTGNILTSQVLLGGHGRNYEDFKKATWEDWQKPILNEYLRLDSLGFKNISLMGSSVGGTLILNLLYTNKCNNSNLPKHIIMIDPIVVASNKLLSVISIVGPLVGYTETTLDSAEVGHWYNYRPQESLQQLQKFLDITRLKLQKGIQLPANMDITVYKSIHDKTADPISAALLYNGIKKYDGSRIDVRMVSSNLHVFTNLHGRRKVSQADRTLQLKTFGEIAKILIP
jgi:carboxylesterase